MEKDGSERRVILAILLSMLVFWVWSALFAPEPPPPPVADEVTEQELGPGTAVPGPGLPVTDDPGLEPTPTLPEQTFAMQGEGWQGEWTTHGGALRNVTLPEHPGPLEVTPIYRWLIGKVTGIAPEPWRPYQEIRPFERLLTEEAALGVAGGMGTAFEDGAYEVVQVSASEAVFQRVTDDGLRITKRFQTDRESYRGLLEVTFENVGSRRLVGDLWVGVTDLVEGKAGRYSNAARPTAVVAQDLEIFDSPKDYQIGSTLPGQVSWLGIASRYFVTALIPMEGTTGELLVQTTGPDEMGVFMVDRAVAMEPGQQHRLSFHVFNGPKAQTLLREVGHDLEKSIDYGWFGFFAKILYWLLRHIHSLLGNWGVAIIGLTFLVKMAFFPLTQKAFKSAKEMQRIQPMLKEMKEKYKDDQEMQSRETMRLFKEHKVNPLGGCLPTLIQLPVWIALYNVLLFSADLYHSNFLVWKDLSEQDPFAVLPLVVGVLMFLQQRMMPMTGMDPMQAKLMRMMPLIFVFFIFSFPSGLALYIMVNSVLTIFQQWIINRQYGKTEPATQ